MRTVLVTGGSGGIGRAICLEFARAGWTVGVHFHQRKDAAEETAAAVKEAGGTGLLLQADIRHAPAVRAMVESFAAQSGRLDVLVCSAGQATSRLVLRLAPEDWCDTLAVNLGGTYHCLQAAGRVMAAQRSGAALVVGSLAALQGQPGQAAYAAAKAGLLGLVKTAAREWGPSNIRVNMVLPGWHRTDLAGDAVPVDPVPTHVLGRLANLPSVARTIYHLALLEDASGQVWNLDSRIL
jgi:3-oxoacyl-[acyl-carrier protein] reductase